MSDRLTNRRTVLKSIGAGTAVLAGGATGLVSAREGGREGASAESGIVATADELGFSTLITAVENADPIVVETLTNDDQYTVFAPTNDAFSSFVKEIPFNLEELLNDPNGALTNTLLFHVTEGRRYSQSVLNPADVETLLGEPISVEDGILDERAEVVTADVEASNGVIHAIDAVLTTPSIDELL